MRIIFALLFLIGLLFARQRTVLVEIFASTTCQYCASAVRGVEELKNYHSDTVSVLVYYPGATDPFRAPESYQRALYYSISGVPVAIFDGTKRVDGGSNPGTSMYSVYKDTFDVRKVVDQPIDFEVSGTYDPNSRRGELIVTIHNPSGDTISGYLRTAEVLMDSSYQWQDMDHLFYFVRKMFPDAKGIFVKVPSYDAVSLNIEFSVGSEDSEDKVAFILFLQDDETRGVIGSRPEVKLTSLNWSGISEAAEDKVKVISGRKGVRFLVVNGLESSNLTVFDAQGRKVFEIGKLKGELFLSLGPGVYFYHLEGHSGKFVVY